MSNLLRRAMVTDVRASGKSVEVRLKRVVVLRDLLSLRDNTCHVQFTLQSRALHESGYDKRHNIAEI